MRRLLAAPLFWPLAALAVLLLGNGLVNPGFLGLQLREGHLYGNLVDIANRASPLALVAMAARHGFGRLSKGLIALSVAFCLYGVAWAVRMGHS